VAEKAHVSGAVFVCALHTAVLTRKTEPLEEVAGGAGAAVGGLGRGACGAGGVALQAALVGVWVEPVVARTLASPALLVLRRIGACYAVVVVGSVASGAV
jgi:hypothetical protein